MDLTPDQAVTLLRTWLSGPTFGETTGAEWEAIGPPMDALLLLCRAHTPLHAAAPSERDHVVIATDTLHKGLARVAALSVLIDDPALLDRCAAFFVDCSRAIGAVIPDGSPVRDGIAKDLRGEATRANVIGGHLSEIAMYRRADRKAGLSDPHGRLAAIDTATLTLLRRDSPGNAHRDLVWAVAHALRHAAPSELMPLAHRALMAGRLVRVRAQDPEWGPPAAAIEGVGIAALDVATLAGNARPDRDDAAAWGAWLGLAPLRSHRDPGAPGGQWTTAATSNAQPASLEAELARRALRAVLAGENAPEHAGMEAMGGGARALRHLLHAMPRRSPGADSSSGAVRADEIVVDAQGVDRAETACRAYDAIVDALDGAEIPAPELAAAWAAAKQASPPGGQGPGHIPPPINAAAAAVAAVLAVTRSPQDGWAVDPVTLARQGGPEIARLIGRILAAGGPIAHESCATIVHQQTQSILRSFEGFQGLG